LLCILVSEVPDITKGESMTRTKLSFLFLGKEDDTYCSAALDFCRLHSNKVTSCLGKWGDPLPDDVETWHGDYIISYLSRWVVPEILLKRARKAAFNFHPASPEYPGIGCNNFALYEDAKEFGVTCHHMAPRVDTGSIIKVLRFPVFPVDTVATLLARTYAYQLVLFYDIVAGIFSGRELPVSEENWTREPFTREQFNDLMKITPDMSREEIARRVRATSFGSYQPSVELGGYSFGLRTG